jgi:hypothetical protein
VKDNHLSRLYREGSWPEPSRQIDQAILAASRRAVREERSFARRWAPPVAVAATVVLTSVLVLKVVREQPEVVSTAGTEQQVTVTRSKQAAPPEAKAVETQAAPAPTPAPQAAATPKGYSETMDAAEAARLDRLKRDLDLKQSGIPTESPVRAPAPAAKKEQVQRQREQPATSPATPISVFGATPAAPAPAQQVPRAAASKPVAAFPPNKEAAPVPPAQPMAAEAERAPAPSTAAALSSGNTAAPAPERSPQAWIEDIRKLMKEGKSEEAGGEIAKFRKRYPDFVLPEDLR